jgi:hypothetical protein
MSFVQDEYPQPYPCRLVSPACIHVFVLIIHSTRTIYIRMHSRTHTHKHTYIHITSAIRIPSALCFADQLLFHVRMAFCSSLMITTSSLPSTFKDSDSVRFDLISLCTSAYMSRRTGCRSESNVSSCPWVVSGCAGPELCVCIYVCMYVCACVLDVVWYLDVQALSSMYVCICVCIYVSNYSKCSVRCFRD